MTNRSAAGGAGLHPRRAVMLGAGLAALGGAVAGGVRFVRTPGRTEPRLFGISVEGSSESTIEQIVDLDTRLNRVLNVVNIFQAWGWGRAFPMAAANAISLIGCTPEISWEPWRPDGDIRDQPMFALDRLGRYDDYVDEFARGCAAYGKPLYLRFAHEMNSNWYPWGVTVNGNTPQQYVRAHRSLHERFQRAAATNVRWVWCPNVILADRVDLIVESYPGCDVVDVVGLDGYNRGDRNPYEVFAQSLDVVGEIAPQKPHWINEVGTVSGPGEAQWIRDFFAFMDLRDVRCVVWFEINKSTAPDWRLTRSASSVEAAREALRSW